MDVLLFLSAHQENGQYHLPYDGQSVLLHAQPVVVALLEHVVRSNCSLHSDINPIFIKELAIFSLRFYIKVQ
jgi:hypothetical protein